MGQTASNFINRTIFIDEEYSEMDSRLLQYRQSLMRAVLQGDDINYPLQNLITLPCPVSLKYAVLNVKQILELNNRSVEELKKIPVALNILEKYGRHLLKPLEARAEMWRSVKYSNPIYKERVEPLKGGKEIMTSMGYTMEVEDGVYFPEDKKPDINQTTNLVTDIIMARKEMELYISGCHPRPADIEQYLPHNTVISVKILLQGGNNKYSPVAPKKAIIQSETNESRDPETSSPSMCDLCLINKAEIYCEACDMKMLCESCDQTWHSHPRRQLHDKSRKKLVAGIALVPSSRIAHQGAYGVTEVIQRKDGSRSQLPPVSPKPVSVPQDVRPPPTYNTSFPKFDTLVSQSIDEEDPRLQQMKLKSQSVFVEANGAVPTTTKSDNDINEKLKTYRMKINSYSSQSKSYKPVSFNSTAHQTSTNNTSANAENEQSDAVRYPPSVAYQSTSPMPDPAPAHVQVNSKSSVTLPRAGISMSPLTEGGVTEVSIKSNQTSLAQQSKTIHSSLSRGLQAPQAKLSSSPTSSMSKSKLLTKIMTIPNIDHRKSKCEINLLTLDDELTELDENLNEILTQDDQFLQNENFVSLNRKKSVLIREKKTIDEYLRNLELETAVDKHVQDLGDSDHNNLSQTVYYPPESVEVAGTTQYGRPSSQTALEEPPAQAIAAYATGLPPGVHLQRINYQPPSYNPKTMGSGEIAWPPSQIPQNIPAPSMSQGAKPKVFANKQLFPEEKVNNASNTSIASGKVDIEPTALSSPAARNLSSSSIAGHHNIWACEHCTYVNNAGTRVCIICNKTSDSPEIIDYVVVEKEPDLPPADSVGNKLNELQDQVYLEKKEAHRQYQASLRLTSSNKQLSHSDGITAPLDDSVYEPVFQEPEVKQTTSPRLQQITPVTPVSTSSLPDKVHAKSSSTRKSAGGLSENSSRTPDSDQFSNISEYSSNRSFKGTGTFQQLMKQNNEIREQKHIQIEGAELFNMVKRADKQGYDIEEIQVALEQSPNGGRSIIQWLEENWQGVVDHVAAEATREGHKLAKNTVGEVSDLESKNALKKSKGNVEAAVRDCISARQKLYAEVNGEEQFDHVTVLDAMLQCLGDPEKVQDQLLQIHLQPFIERIWEGSEGVVTSACNDERCSSVSTNIIKKETFQNTIKNKEIERERRIRMILIEGKLKSWGRAETVIKIVDQELFKDGFEACTLEDVIEAVRNCGDMKSSLAYLQQYCELCYAPFPMNKITSLNICQCKLCLECVQLYFEDCVKEKNVRKWTCPVCSGPNMSDQNTAQAYLAFLKLLISNISSQATQDLFDHKANLWQIQQDPNFRWCAHCSSGHIFHGGPNNLCMRCENCHNKTCFMCKKPWEAQHEGLSCVDFEQWKFDNDPDNQAVGLAKHLQENGIDCPSCKMRFSLAKGGCMHFTCPQCSHEFCSGCYQPFYHENTCPKKCKGKGLHCHHPRDCYFYLRDEDPKTLQEILEIHKKPFNKDIPNSPTTCPVMEQKERAASSYDDEACGREVQAGWAGLCLLHYKEYLVGVINQHCLDPLDVIKDEDTLKTICLRLNIKYDAIRESETRTCFLKRIKKKIIKAEPLHRNTGQRPASVVYI